MLEDIAILTGGTVIAEESGYTSEKRNLEMLELPKKITIDKDNTTIVNAGEADMIKTNQSNHKWKLLHLITIKRNCNEAAHENAQRHRQLLLSR
jgi:chaperonin GroEL (HSP60 family)